MKSIDQELGDAASGCSHLGSAPICLHLGQKIRQGSCGKIQHSIARVYVEEKVFWKS